MFIPSRWQGIEIFCFIGLNIYVLRLMIYMIYLLVDDVPTHWICCHTTQPVYKNAVLQHQCFFLTSFIFSTSTIATFSAALFPSSWSRSHIHAYTITHIMLVNSSLMIIVSIIIIIITSTSDVHTVHHCPYAEYFYFHFFKHTFILPLMVIVLVFV